MKTIIETVINSLVTCTFIYGWKGWQNLATDEVQDTMVCLDLLRSNDVMAANGSALIESYIINMGFFEKSDNDLTPDEYDSICVDMRTLREKFLRELNQYEGIHRITNIQTLDTPKEFDANFTGVLVSFTVEADAVRTC